MKKYIIGLLALVFTLGVFSVNAADTKDVQKLMNMMKSGEINMWNTNPPVVCIHENTGMHDNFPTKYKEHYALIENGKFLSLIMRDYTEFYSLDARGFVMFAAVDFNCDVIVDRWAKHYVILVNGNYILSPKYPNGYLNNDWNKMTKAEAQERFDYELKYILENSDKATKG